MRHQSTALPGVRDSAPARSMGAQTASYDSAGPVSRALVSWLTPLLRLGRRRPLLRDDLPVIGRTHAAARMREQLRAAWEAERRRGTAGRSVLLRALARAFGRNYAWALALKLLGDACTLATPLVLKLLLEDLGTPPDARTGWRSALLCAGMFALQQANTLLVNAYFTLAQMAGVQARTAATALVHDKALRLSGRARAEHTHGRVVNMVAGDAFRIEAAAGMALYLISGPVLLLSMLGMLAYLLGWAILAGVSVIVFCAVLQAALVRRMGASRSAASAASDRRVRAMQELVAGIRVVKLYGWERPFWDRLDALRAAELAAVRRTTALRVTTVLLSSAGTVLCCVLSFVVYRCVLGAPLTPSLVFTAMLIFANLRLPLLLLPMVINLTIDGAVGIGRIERFLLAPELAAGPDKRGAPGCGVLVERASFAYEAAEPASDVVALRDIALRVPAGALVAVVGPVGSGKSSLLAALVGELAPVPASDAKAPGALGYEPNSRTAATACTDQAESAAGPPAEIPDAGGDQADPSAPIDGTDAAKGPAESQSLDDAPATSNHTSRVLMDGDAAYCPQQAWIQNGSVRDNILFGAAMDAARYAAVLDACALRPDLAALPDGDETPVGERGVGLSGGQKQRISLARAAYSDAAVVLLDDPLSAVDAHVGAHLVRACICGVLAGRTRVLATHQVHLVSAADIVVVMRAGRVAEVGAYDALAADESSAFAEMLRASGTLGGGPEADEAVQAQKPPATAAPETPRQRAAGTDEERVVGAVSLDVYRGYVAAAGGLAALVLVAATILLANGLRIATDYVLRLWSSPERRWALLPDPTAASGFYARLYVLAAVLQILAQLANAVVFGDACLRAARRMHRRAAQAVLHASVPAFFDVSPVGRVLSRFSKDVDVLDNALFETLRMVLQTLVMSATSLLLLVVELGWRMALALALLLAVYHAVQTYYRASCREVKRLEGLLRAPVVAHVSEVLSGLPTVRAFGRQGAFSRRFCDLLDSYNSAAVVQLALQRWLSVRLDTLGALVVLAVGACVYVVAVDASAAGMALLYASAATAVMSWFVRQASEAEVALVSAERLAHYAARLPQEAPQRRPGADPPRGSWPSAGAIRISSLRMAYRPGLPAVIRGLSADIRPGERVGVVGRTGAGKSSLMLALFRVVEPSREPTVGAVDDAAAGNYIASAQVITSASKMADNAAAGNRPASAQPDSAVFEKEGPGATDLAKVETVAITPHGEREDSAPIIEIDGVDIQRVGLHCLRSRLSIIPQDPVVFADTVRWNLDPHGECTDAQLWDAVDAAHLRPTITGLAGGLGLDAPLAEGGENLSVGQRQLLCLARAVLRRSRVLVLDEATASVDRATDAHIQAAIRGPAFAGATILTIAHRVDTILDYDRIMVLDAGRVVEFDSPAALLARPGGVFASLVRESRARSSRPQSPSVSAQ